jgi:hypothetical protein
MILMPSNKCTRIAKRAVFASGDRQAKGEHQESQLKNVKEIHAIGI